VVRAILLTKEVQLVANVGRWGRNCLKLGGPAQLGLNFCNSDTETALDLGNVSTVADVAAFIEMMEVVRSSSRSSRGGLGLIYASECDTNGESALILRCNHLDSSERLQRYSRSSEDFTFNR
jgi:hypothetical protein